MDLDIPGELIGRVLTDIDPKLAASWGGYFGNRTLENERSTDWRVAIEEIRPRSRETVVADVGCGPGVFLLYLRRLKFQHLIGSDLQLQHLVVGEQLHSRFDLGAPRPRWMRSNGGDALQTMDVDIVTAFDWLFEHEELLPRFLVTVPARAAIISLSPPTAPKKLSRVHRTEGEVRRLAAKCGWWTARIDTDGQRGRVTYVLHRKTSL